MKPYDKSVIKINGKKYLLEYQQRDGTTGAAGFGFNIVDPDTGDSAGYLRVLIFGTASAVWENHTKYSYSDFEGAQNTARLAIDAVIPSLNLHVDEDYLEAMRYRGDAIIIQITTLDDAVAEGGALVTLKSYLSPEEFVSKHLFGDDNSQTKIRNAILARINKWEEANYGLPYSTKNLETELFLPRIVVHRMVDYLAGQGVEFLSKSAAGDDEFNLKLNPAGIDHLASLEEIHASEASMFAQVQLDPAMFEGLNKVDPSLGRSYQQVIADLNDENRTSWKGTANELRETLSALLRALAPDAKVIADKKYIAVKGTSGPTQKQRVQYILKQRNAGSKEVEVAKEVDIFDDRIGGFIGKFYERASNSAHTPAERKELLKIHSYFVAFMHDLLDL